MSDSPLLAAALEYAKRGWPIIPLHTPRPGGGCSCNGQSKNCKPGKHPRTRCGLKDASTDETRICRWWAMWSDANIGILTGGPCGLVALDVDPRNSGMESLAALQRENGPFPQTLVSRTGGGGLHYIFKYPGQQVRNSAGTIAPGIDMKGDGGYIVAPPSLHPSGNHYQWEDESIPPAPMPNYLLTHRTEHTEQTEHTKQNEQAEQTNSSVGVWLLDFPPVKAAIASTLPERIGRRNRRIFDLVRELKAIPECADLPEQSFRPVVQEWHRQAQPNSTSEWFESWTDFLVAWRKAVCAKGEDFLDKTLAAADRNPDVPCSPDYDPLARRLLNWCAELQRIKPGGFILTCRDAAKRLLCHDHRKIAGLLKLFSTDGFLTVLGKTAKKAYLYRYIPPAGHYGTPAADGSSQPFEPATSQAKAVQCQRERI